MSLYKTKWGWRYLFRHQGKMYGKSGFKTKKAARTAMEERRAEVTKDSKTEPKDSALSSLVVEYLDANQGKLAEKTWRYKQFVFNNFLAHAGDFPLDDITSLIVNNYLKTRPSGYNANFHRKDLAALFSWGMKHGLCQHNPVTAVEKFKENQKPSLIPTPEEVAKVWEAAGEYLPLLMVVAHTMGRRGEILRLRWDDVNFREKKITLWTRKRRSGNLEPDTLPMSEELYQVLQELYNQRTQDEWVFLNPKTGTQFKSRPKVMHTVCKRAGVRHFGFHTLRHYTPSDLLEQGVSMKTLQRLLRHTQLRTTERYLHSVGDELRAAVNKIPGPEKMGDEPSPAEISEP
jgi:integrase